MPPYSAYALAATAAILAATAIASRHHNGVEVPEPAVQTQRANARPAGINVEASYLPALFGEEERAARMEPLPPQF
jgi:hypothetical protein